MAKIYMTDLLSTTAVIKNEIEKSIAQILSDCSFVGGPYVKTFEEELALFHGTKHCISCANGTDALQISMMAAGLKSGDEIIIPSFTYIATAEAAALLGIKPIFIECDPLSFTISIDEIEKHITLNTKAIIPVHLFGQCADMEPILQIAKKYRLLVIEDSAQSIGATYTFSNGECKKAGAIGDIGITSFYPSKNLGGFGDGGAIFTNDDTLADTIRMICNHGQKEKYLHAIIGLNSRLDAIQAAILSVKLRKLKEYTSARQSAALSYDKKLGRHPSITIPTKNKKSSHVYNQYTVLLAQKDRPALQKYLSEKDIPSMVYYPVPIHMQKAFDFLQYKKGDLPVTEELCDRVLSIPMHAALEEEQLDYISSAIINYYS